jgi:3-deoxy-D-manno-octulosonate 8-phosphate phosphatase (KDO 8-P phosphatase)
MSGGYLMVRIIPNPKLIVLDVDGVLTSGKKLYGPTGDCIGKEFDDKDFTAIKVFKALGVDVVWLTADHLNKSIADKRNISCFLSRDPDGTIDKVTPFLNILKLYNVTADDTWYVGDDLFDCEIFELCPNSFCPSNTPIYVKSNVEVVLKTYGGNGIVVELLEMLLYREPIDLKKLLPKIKELDAKEK